jgi:hypothetical protein
MKNKFTKMLPKTAGEISNGGLYRQAVRCGKARCRCASGDLHTGYFYFIYRLNGKLRKTYVRKLDVAAIQRFIQQSRRNRREQRQTRSVSMELFGDFASALRQNESLVDNLRRTVSDE